MHRLIIVALITMMAAPAFAADNLKTEEQKTLYSVGLLVARQLAALNLDPAEVEIIKEGLTDSVSGKTPRVDIDTYGKGVQEFIAARRKAEGEKLAAGGKDFLDKAAAEKGALRTASGLVYRSIREGSGASPTPADKAKLSYRATFINGKEFDSSSRHGLTVVELPLSGVIKCWQEGLQMMKPGGKAQLVCPANIAYGEASAGGGMIPPNATLVFEIELVDTVKPPAPQQTK